MKKLKKILLINWLYFDRELIEVGGRELSDRQKRRRQVHRHRRAPDRAPRRDQRAELQSRRERALAAHAGRLSARRHGREQSTLAPRKGFFRVISPASFMMMRSAAASCAASCSTAAATAAAATISSSTPARCRKTASSRTGGHRPAEPAPLSQGELPPGGGLRDPVGIPPQSARAGMYIPSRCSAC